MNVYLQEIKNRVILTAFGTFFSLIICYFYKKILLFVVLNSYKSFLFNCGTFNFIVTDVTEILFVYLQIIKFLVVQMIYILFFYHVFTFTVFALHYYEFTFFKKLILFCFSVWINSAFFFNFFLLPASWKFFYSFQVLSNSQDELFLFYFEAKLSDFVSFYIFFYYLCLFYFQSFLILSYFFSLINNKIFYVKQFRKIYYYIFFIFSTFLSPPDIFSQVFLCFLAIIVYEFILLIQLLRSNIIKMASS